MWPWISYVASSVHHPLVGNKQGDVDLLPNQRKSVIKALGESVSLSQIQGSEHLLAAEIGDAR